MNVMRLGGVREELAVRFEVLRSNAAFSKMSATRQASVIAPLLIRYLQKEKVNKTQSGGFESFSSKKRLLRYGGESARFLCLVFTVHKRAAIFQHLDPRLRGQRLPPSGKGAADTARMFGLPSSSVFELYITFQHKQHALVISMTALFFTASMNRI